ncbi:MAG: FUSC family protein [Chitinophagaceae bacterium]
MTFTRIRQKFENRTGLNTYQLLEYIIKCIVGVAGTFLLFLIFPTFHDQLYWVIISVMLSITYDNDSKAAVDRMKGNLMGSIVGLIGYFLEMFVNRTDVFSQFTAPASSLVLIITGVIITIVLCALLGFISVTRTALVAYFIVMIYEDNHHSYYGAIMRLVSTVTGCLLGLIINKTFNWFIRKTVEEVKAVIMSRKDKSKEEEENSIY